MTKTELLGKRNFSHAFLIALSNWQRGWHENQQNRRLVADELIKQCEQLPDQFKRVDGHCFRKRFILAGEVVPIIWDDDFFEGLASWTSNIDYAKGFKGLIKEDSKFTAVFKHEPSPEEIVVNIIALWADDDFKKAVEKLNESHPEDARPLFNFKDFQSEIILRSTLKGSELEHLAVISSSFETICDMGNIPQEEREALSIKYAQDSDGIPIEMRVLAGTRVTKAAISKTVEEFRGRINAAKIANHNVDWSNAISPHSDDLKHRL